LPVGRPRTVLTTAEFRLSLRVGRCGGEDAARERGEDREPDAGCIRTP